MRNNGRTNASPLQRTSWRTFQLTSERQIGGLHSISQYHRQRRHGSRNHPGEEQTITERRRA